MSGLIFISREANPAHADSTTFCACYYSPTHISTETGAMPKKGKKSDKKDQGKKGGKDEEEKEVEKKPFEAPDSTSKELELQKESVYWRLLATQLVLL